MYDSKRTKNLKSITTKFDKIETKKYWENVKKVNKIEKNGGKNDKID